MERRQSPRVKRSLLVAMSALGHPYGVYETDNLCVDGLFLVLPQTQLKRGDRLTLHVETTLAGIHMIGYVAHKSAHGVGIQLAHRYLHYAHDVLAALVKDAEMAGRSAGAPLTNKP